MVNKWQFITLTGLGLLCLVLALTNVVLYSANRQAQQEFAVRAQYIQQSQQVEPVYQGLIRALAELAARNNDDEIRKLLESQGIRYSFAPARPAAVE